MFCIILYITLDCLVVSGKYVGSRPIRLRKSTWKDRAFLEVKKKDKERKKMGLLR